MVPSIASAVLFDLDGTLLDSKPGIVFSFSAACRLNDLPIPDDRTLNQFIGPPLPVILRDYYGIVDTDFIARFVDDYRKYYLANGMFKAEPFLGIGKILEQLKLSASLFVATSKPRIHAKSMLEHFGLAGHFTSVHGAELDGERHDKSDLLAYILRAEGLTPADTAMIGDRRYDIDGARANGCFLSASCGVTVPERNLKRPVPVFFVKLPAVCWIACRRDGALKKTVNPVFMCRLWYDSGCQVSSTELETKKPKLAGHASR